MIKSYAKSALIALLSVVFTDVFSQNVAINTTGVPPFNTSVLFDLSNNLTN